MFYIGCRHCRHPCCGIRTEHPRRRMTSESCTTSTLEMIWRDRDTTENTVSIVCHTWVMHDRYAINFGGEQLAS